MSPARLSKPAQRALAMGMLILVIGASAAAALAPFLRLRALDGEIQAGAQLLAQLNDQEGREAYMRSAQAALAGAGGQDPLLDGDTSGKAGADLQRLLGDLARRNGLSVRSIQVLGPQRDGRNEARREGELSEISVELSMAGHSRGLREFLHTAETGTPLLMISELSVRSATSPRTDAQPTLLEINLKVRGYGAGRDGN